MRGILNVIKENKDSVFKIGCGLVGTAIGLLVAGCFAEDEEIIDLDEFVVKPAESTTEEPAETVEG